MKPIERLHRAAQAIDGAEGKEQKAQIWREWLKYFHHDRHHLAQEVDLCDSYLMRIETHSGMASFVKRVRSGLKEQAKRPKLREVDTVEILTIGHIFGDRPEEDQELRIPDGYTIGPGGVLGPENQDGDRPLISPRPVYISALLRDEQTGEIHADLSWLQQGGRWSTETVKRLTISDARALVKMSARGLSVTSVTAAALVKYLSAFEACNRDALPVYAASAVLGFQEGGRSFLWGEEPIGGNVRLLADTGKLQIAKSYRRSGSLDGWGQIWRRIQKHPRIALAVYVALSPLVLGLVPAAPGFVVDYSGRSTGGKTTTLRVAASVWGDPDSLIYQWRATMNAIEHVASFSRHLPTFLDDTKQASDNPRKVAAVIYQTTGLKGKLRASPDGLRETSSFRTVVISTGEVSATSFTEDVGAHARTLCIRGFPLSGDNDEENRKTAEWLRLVCSDHFGLIGPLCVQRSIRNRDRVMELRRHWERYRDEEAARNPGSAFGGRSAPYIATIRIAAEIMAEATGFGVLEAAIDSARLWADRSAQVARRHAQALQDVLGYAASKQDAFMSKATTPKGSEVFGRWEKDEAPAIICRLVEDYLTRSGYDVEGTIAEWQREGWIECQNGRKRKQIRIGKGRPYCYAFTSAALAQS